MSTGGLTVEEKQTLLRLARQAIQQAVDGRTLEPLNLEEYPARLRQPGAAFVTLTRAGRLRGCIGTLEAYQPLAEDVREHAVAAALGDYRFSPVQAREVDQLDIEISCLTEPKPLEYEGPQDLIQKLRPGIDGVVIKDGILRATFLPQVWESLAEPEVFLQQLCLKMGASGNAWRMKKLTVLTYQVEEFHENQ